jgi:hypothetical protein
MSPLNIMYADETMLNIWEAAHFFLGVAESKYTDFVWAII